MGIWESDVIVPYLDYSGGKKIKWWLYICLFSSIHQRTNFTIFKVRIKFKTLEKERKKKEENKTQTPATAV